MTRQYKGILNANEKPGHMKCACIQDTSELILQDPSSNPGLNPGSDPSSDPGSDPGSNPGSNPSSNPGSNAGSDPGSDPGSKFRYPLPETGRYCIQLFSRK